MKNRVQILRKCGNICKVHEENMFAISAQEEPYVDEYKEYTLPLLCENKIYEVCKDIILKGNKTNYQAIYDAMYELVEADIEQGE